MHCKLKCVIPCFLTFCSNDLPCSVFIHNFLIMQLTYSYLYQDILSLQFGLLGSVHLKTLIQQHSAKIDLFLQQNHYIYDHDHLLNKKTINFHTRSLTPKFM